MSGTSLYRQSIDLGVRGDKEELGLINLSEFEVIDGIVIIQLQAGKETVNNLCQYYAVIV